MERLDEMDGKPSRSIPVRAIDGDRHSPTREVVSLHSDKKPDFDPKVASTVGEFKNPNNTYGKSVKEVRLQDKSFKEIDELLVSKGFKRENGNITNMQTNRPELG